MEETLALALELKPFYCTLYVKMSFFGESAKSVKVSICVACNVAKWLGIHVYLHRTKLVICSSAQGLSGAIFCATRSLVGHDNTGRWVDG